MNLKKMITPAALAMALAFGTAGAASAQHHDNRGRSQDNARAQNSQPQRAQNSQPQQRGPTEQAVQTQPAAFNAGAAAAFQNAHAAGAAR